MISRKELEEYAKARGMQNIGHAEKDYFQNILLFIIYQKFGKEIVFKGGTALYKFYGLKRFSEDLDFTAEKEINFDFIDEGLKRFKLDYDKKEENYAASKSIILRIKGPLYNGTKNSLCKVILDFSFREIIMEKTNIKTLGRFMEEIPSFDVVVMAEKEMLAEKVRAILTRNKARDVYDFWFLLKEGAVLDENLIKKKLEFYNKAFNTKELLKAIKEKEGIWHSELSGLIKDAPDFAEVVRDIKRRVENYSNLKKPKH